MGDEKKQGLRIAANRAKAAEAPKKTYEYQVCAPRLYPGVVPANKTAPVLAMDASHYTFAQDSFPGGGFPGFQYLANLATRAEYRAFAQALSTEITREWIKFTSQQDDDTNTADKIKAIEAEFKRLDVRGAIQKIAEHDCLFGRGQLFFDVVGADDVAETPLVLDPRTVPVKSLKQVVPVEAVWTTPSAYNANNPAAPDFYRPSSWFMLGREVHASRLHTVITRPLPDILKPAFNFAGMSLSQLAEPYVDNWLRTRQSVSDLIYNFSITVLATSMDQILQGEDDGADLMARAELFTATRSNKGLMLVDKDREDVMQVNTPLSGLHELQAQSQEQMCSVSRMPAIVLTGISPSGLNASSDGEIRIFYDWIAALQEAHFRQPIETTLQLVQLSLFGEIDSDIGFEFVPLYQMTPKEQAEINKSKADTAAVYVSSGILDPSEERERLARDPESGYQGLDTTVELVDPNDVPGKEPAPEAMDGEFEENKHPRADNGQFGSGGGGASKAEPSSKKSSAAFEKWFAGSKVVDESGQPKVVYHGTNAEFDKFDTKLSRDLGAHFGTKEQAETFGKNVKPVYLSIKNPLRVDDNFSTLNGLGRFMNDIYYEVDMSSAESDLLNGYAKKVANLWDDDRDADNTKIPEAKKFWKLAEKILKRSGFDGLVYKNKVEGEGDSYIAFSANQIKPA